MQDTLSKIGMLPFKPLPLLSHGRTQTLAARYFPFHSIITNNLHHIITLPCEDRIALIENRPSHWRPSKRIILLVHGLSGSHLSSYMVRLAHHFLRAGCCVIRMNLRGCGSGAGLAQHLYHSGRSEDTRAVLAWLKQHYPDSPVTQIGFSLGGNITLKMAGEDGKMPSGNLDSVIAVSPPLDLAASVKLIIHPKNRIFDAYFVNELRTEIKKIHQAFPTLPPVDLPKKLNLYDFDDLYTAPRSGFKNALDYYQRASSLQFIHNITIPTLILYALDDPMINRSAFLRLPKQKNLEVIITKKGGHVGWLGKTDQFFNFRWMDRVLVKWGVWIDEHANTI